jgi:DNA-binding PadR family transcriptional regulator
MTEAMYYVLLALTNPAHGYKLMQEISDVSQGRLKMGPGTLYGVLTRMQGDKLIRMAEDDGRRKIYRITQEGEDALRVEYRRLAAMVRDGVVIEGSGESGFAKNDGSRGIAEGGGDRG